MTPEQRIALRLLGKELPPVDIAAIAGRLANIEYAPIPTEADAILLYPSRKRSRPLIILNEGRPETRTRFTLAHEIGHIAIPWHVGEMVYHQDWRGKFDDYAHSEMEGEANRLASELLMPSEWLSEIVEAHSRMSEMFQMVLSANVSGPAAALALVRSLPRGYIFAQADIETGTVRMSAGSQGTPAVPPEDDSVVTEQTYQEVHAEHEQVNDRTSAFHWWHFPERIKLAEPTPKLSSRQLLDQIYAEFGITGEDRKNLDYRISGIIGSANSRLGRMPWQQRHAILTQAFGGRGTKVPVVSHPQFVAFLALRAKEISSRDE